MLKKILIIITSALVAFIFYVASRPSDFKVERSVVISQNVSVIFDNVNNQMKWMDWSPWAKLDPQMKVFFGGEEKGTGSVYKWEGNDKVGSGSSKITDSKKDEYVKFQLDFLKPFKASATSEFHFSKVENGTSVIWTLEAKKGFLQKLFGLFINCEEMVGSDFEKGLENLKKLSQEAEVK
jgi:hypothetical protein